MSKAKETTTLGGTGNSRLLFVDPDTGFLNTLRTDRKATHVPPWTAELGSQAMGVINDPKNEISGIFINPLVKSPDAISVIRCAHQARPATPIYLIYDGEEPPIDEDALRRIGVLGTMPKTFTYAEIAKQFVPPSMLFDPQEAIEMARRDPLPIGHEASEADSEFIPIRARHFVSGQKSVFDVHVRLESGKYLKVLRAGDDFSQDRLDKYVRSGVTHFYIHKEMQEQYLAYCDRLLTAITSHPGVPLETKIEKNLEQGQKTIEYLRDKVQIGPEALQFGASYVKNLMSLVKALDLPGQSKLVSTFLASQEAMDHSVGVVLLAGILARKLGFEADKSVLIIGLASLFHDVALFQNPEVMGEDEEKMTPDQLKAFHAHPQKSSQILQSFRSVDPVVCQTIAHHHRRRNGTGFPNSGVGLTQLSLPAEVVGIADEIVRVHLSNPGATKYDLETMMELRIFGGFSPEVVSALRPILKI